MKSKMKHATPFVLLYFLVLLLSVRGVVKDTTKLPFKLLLLCISATSALLYAVDYSIAIDKNKIPNDRGLDRNNADMLDTAKIAVVPNNNRHHSKAFHTSLAGLQLAISALDWGVNDEV